MAEYNDRDYRLTGGELATVERIQFPHPFTSVEPPTKTTPIPLRALRHQRQVIGLISTAQ